MTWLFRSLMSPFLILLTLSQVGHVLAQDLGDVLEQRPVELPLLTPREPCPISTGARDTVPKQAHIFGAPPWFGAGPVYLSLAWKASPDDGARFSLDPVPREKDARRAKTPWVSVPSYSGPILIRGRSLDANGATLRFKASGRAPKDELQLEAPNAPSSPLWSFWPSSMYVPRPGCYGLQIDTLSGTDVVVFEAT